MHPTIGSWLIGVRWGTVSYDIVYGVFSSFVFIYRVYYNGTEEEYRLTTVHSA